MLACCPTRLVQDPGTDGQVGQRARLRLGVPAQQLADEFLRDDVVPNGLRSDPLGFEEVKRGLSITPSLGLRPCKIKAELGPPARQPDGQPLWIYIRGQPDRFTGVAQLDGDRDTMDGNICRAERCPSVVGILAEHPGQAIGLVEPGPGFGALGSPSSDDRSNEPSAPAAETRLGASGRAAIVSRSANRSVKSSASSAWSDGNSAQATW
jgi:hypothetical protein